MKNEVGSLNLSILLIALSLFGISCSSTDDDVAPKEDNKEPETIAHEIIDFEPKLAIENTEVTISGKGFGNDASDVDVMFGEIEASINSISDTEIKVFSPKIKRGSSLKIRVAVNNETIISSATYRYPLPEIYDFSPKTEVLNKDIIITGKYLSEQMSSVSVLLNNSNCAIQSVTQDSIVFHTINSSEILESYPLIVNIDDWGYVSTDSFNYAIQYDLSEKTANNNIRNNVPLSPGSFFTLNINDNRSSSANTTLFLIPDVKIGGVEAQVYSHSPADNGGRNISLVLPTDLPKGELKIQAEFEGSQLIPGDIESLTIGDGYFTVPDSVIGSSDSFKIILSHYFIDAGNMEFKLINQNDGTVITPGIIKTEAINDFTNIEVSFNPIFTSGIFDIEVRSSDGQYQLLPDGSESMVFE